MSDRIPQLFSTTPQNLPGRWHADYVAMLGQWNRKLSRNIMRGLYYDGKNRLKNLRIAIPPSLEKVETVVEWPTKAVDALANRVVFDGFVTTGDDRDPLGLDAVLDDNDFSVELPKAIRSALKHSCSFICVRGGMDDEPNVVVSFRSALYATGLWDYARRRLKCALVIRDYDTKAAIDGIIVPTDLMLYEPGWNIPITRGRNGVYTAGEPQSTGLGHVPVYMLAYHADLDRPFGRSRIDRSVMSITDQAVRTMLRMDISAEFYSAPRAVMIGAEPPVNKEGKPITGWEASVSRMLVVNANEDGQNPTIQQLSQMTMQPHADQMRLLAARMSGATGIPMSRLGVMTDSGPSSAEAQEVAETDLVIEADNTCAAFGAQLRRMAMDIAELSGVNADESQLHALQVNWRNPERPNQASRADAVIKQVQAIPWLAESDVILESLGYDDATITRLLSAKRRNEARKAIDALTQQKALSQKQERDQSGEEAASDDQQAGRGTARDNAESGDQSRSQRDTFVDAVDGQSQSSVAA